MSWFQSVFGMWLPESMKDRAEPRPSPQAEAYEQARRQPGAREVELAETDQAHFKNVMSLHILRNGKVLVTDKQTGELRDATWKEAAVIRKLAIETFGPEIAQAVGLEPE